MLLPTGWIFSGQLISHVLEFLSSEPRRPTDLTLSNACAYRYTYLSGKTRVLMPEYRKKYYKIGTSEVNCHPIPFVIPFVCFYHFYVSRKFNKLAVHQSGH